MRCSSNILSKLYTSVDNFKKNSKSSSNNSYLILNFTYYVNVFLQQALTVKIELNANTN